jgi:hypothetical protein
MVLLLGLFGVALLTPSKTYARCYCNWTRCEYSYPGYCYVNNKYYQWGYRYIGPGCSGSSQCLTASGGTVLCGSCGSGYGDIGEEFDQYIRIDRCIASCSGGSGCSCYGWHDYGCGGTEAGFTCPADQRLYHRACMPNKCRTENRCEYDPACAPPLSCTVSLDPANTNVPVGSGISYTATVTIGYGVVEQVNFSSDNTSVATVDPASDANTPYQTTGNGVDVGSVTITADVIMSGASTCTDTANLNVISPEPWWQVIDADIVADGDIISSIPLSCALPGCNPLLGLEGLGGFPGVPIYGGSADFGDGDASSTNWEANSETLFSKIYDYSFFSKLVKTDVSVTEIDSPSVNGGYFTSGGTASRGYVWYHFDGNTYGDLTINSSINMPGDRKVVLLVDGADLYINDRINVTDGEGFFMAIVGKNDGGNKGNIYIDPSVSHPTEVEIEGVFLAEGEFRTGAGTDQLHVRGMVGAYDGVVLERDLADDSDEPAEVFEYAPDFVLTFPRDLTFRRLRWKEVAP